MRVALALLMAATPVAASGPIYEPTEAVVQETVAKLRPLLPLARLEDGSPVPPETAAQLADDIITPPLARRVARQGSISGELQVCGADWAGTSYLPFMARLRDGGEFDSRQIAFVGMLHGVFQEQVRGALAAVGLRCTKQRVDALQRFARTN